MQVKKRINLPDNSFTGLKNLLNLLGLVSCWTAIILDIIYFAFTANFIGFFIFAQWTPIRYFLFDMAPSKLQKRPASLDRSIPLAIFINYLSIEFPIPQGNFLATLAGAFLATLRAMVNGYGLLFFDTFSAFYAIKNDVTGVPLNDGLDRSDFEEPEQSDEESEEVDNKISSAKQEYENQRIASLLNIWDFPLRRYRTHPNYYFENNEVAPDATDKKTEEA